MTWAAVAAAGAAVVGGAISANASGNAADAQKKALKKSNNLEAQNRNMAYTAYEPYRYAGYNALADLSSLYGWGTPGYTSLNQLIGGNTTGIYNVGGGGGGGGGGMMGMLDPLGLANSKGGQLLMGGGDPLLGKTLGGLLGGNEKSQRAGTINANDGTVDVKGWAPEADAAMSEYLRTGVWNGGKSKRTKAIRSQIDQLRAQGWTYDPATGKGSFPGQMAATPASQPGNMSKFFASPDYQFRMNEGTRNLGNSFAARGGALSGNALRATTELGQNLASQEYGNYVNRLMQMAGYGTMATNNVVNAGTNATNAISNNTQQIGDARASGVLGTAGAIGGALTGMAGAFGNYLGGQSGGSSYWPGSANSLQMTNGGGYYGLPDYLRR